MNQTTECRSGSPFQVGSRIQQSLQEKLHADTRFRSNSFHPIGSQARIPTPQPQQKASNVQVGTPDKSMSPRRVASPTATVQKRSKHMVSRPIHVGSSPRIGSPPIRDVSQQRCGSPNPWQSRRRGSTSPLNQGSSLRILNPRQAYSGEPKSGLARRSFDVYSHGVYYKPKNSCEIQTDQCEIPNPLDLCMSTDLHSEYNPASKIASDCWATCDHDEVEYVYDDGSNPKKSVSTSVGGQNVSEVIIIGRKPPKSPSYYVRPPKFDWNNYHRLSTIHDFLSELETSYPSLCTVGVIGKSLEGRDLKVLKISNSNVTNTSVWIDAGIHGREWIAPAVATYLAHHIVKDFHTHPSAITSKDWYILPVMNPDGYEYTHTQDRMWRKNKARHKGRCVGVDLNRNFSYGWGGKESSEVPYNTKYRGPHAFSEPESSAVRDMLMNSGISFKVYLTLHSYGQVIMFPYACQDELAPDYIRLLEGATAMSRAIFDTSGYIYKVGISRDVMYGAAGTSNDWSYAVCDIPICYLIELRSKRHKFKLPREEIEVTGKEILSCVKALMAYVDTVRFDNKKGSPSVIAKPKVSQNQG